MRSVIHQKIEQVLSQSNLWVKIMPDKIFTDLLNFIADGHITQNSALMGD